jgi:hypothetical protein
MKKLAVIDVKGVSINIIQNNFISLTDIAKHKNSKSDLIIQNWMRNRNTIEFL